MAFWHKLGKDGAIGELKQLDWTTANSTVQFLEATVRSNDEFHYIFCVLHHVSEKILNDPCELGKTVVMLPISRKDYSQRKKEGDDWKTVTVAQTPVEKWFCDYVEANQEAMEGYWQGTIVFNNNPVVFELMKSNPTMTSESLKLVDIKPLGEANYLKDAKIELPKKSSGSWGSGGKGQTEAEKLADRISFVQAALPANGKIDEILKSAYPDCTPEAIASIKQGLIASWLDKMFS